MYVLAVQAFDDDMRKRIARVVLQVRSSDDPSEGSESFSKLAEAAKDLGVEFEDGHAEDTVAVALALWLFDSTTTVLPGGYDAGEFSPNAPVVAVKTFPQELVFMGRATVLIRGLCNRLGIAWNLADEWVPYAEEVLELRKQTQPSRRRRKRLMHAMRSNAVLNAVRGLAQRLISLPFLLARLLAVRVFRVARRMAYLYRFMCGWRSDGDDWHLY